MLGPLDTLIIGGFCGLIIGYVVGTIMWFQPMGKRK